MGTEIAYIYRPVKGRLYVKTPFRSDNRSWLKSLGAKAQRVDGYWVLSRAHFDALIFHCAIRFDAVEIWTDHKVTTKCDTRCQGARPETVSECVCSCLGRGHAGGVEGWNPTGTSVVIDSETVRTHWAIGK